MRWLGEPTCVCVCVSGQHLTFLTMCSHLSLCYVICDQNYLLGRKETTEMADRNKEALLEVIKAFTQTYSYSLQVIITDIIVSSPTDLQWRLFRW